MAYGFEEFRKNFETNSCCLVGGSVETKVSGGKTAKIALVCSYVLNVTVSLLNYGSVLLIVEKADVLVCNKLSVVQSCTYMQRLFQGRFKNALDLSLTKKGNLQTRVLF